MNERNDFRILSLDGGGSKGVYTLGILREVEALAKRLLHEEFDLIYGTSTGAIIAALLALGYDIETVTKMYLEIIPDVMQHKSRSKRSAALRENAEKIFGDKKFGSFLTDIGIVSMHYDNAKPMIFKVSVKQAHGRSSTFAPGFGCTIADALMASTAAFPFFKRLKVQTQNQGEPEVMDGGFVANNPTLFAIADAIKAYKLPKEMLRVLSLGVGIYNEPQRKFYYRLLFKLWPFYLTPKILDASTNTIEQLRAILFPEVQTVRINDAFPQKEYETDLLESDRDKLMKLNSLGRESFAKQEGRLKEVFGW
ncbi:MAG: patatin-like phospholipase family protein [Blastocatellales bacterium]